MRPRPWLRTLALAAVVAGCGSDSPTGPFRAATDAAPSGLDVTFTLARPYADSLAGHPTVAAAGDSVVVAGVLVGGDCPFHVTASAGVVDGALVVTSVSSFPDTPVICALIAYSSGPAFRAVVRPAPRGRYTVVLRERVQSQAGTSAYQEREITRQAVALP